MVAGLDFNGFRQVEIERGHATDPVTRVAHIVTVGGPLAGWYVDIARVCCGLGSVADSTPVDRAVTGCTCDRANASVKTHYHHKGTAGQMSSPRGDTRSGLADVTVGIDSGRLCAPAEELLNDDGNDNQEDQSENEWEDAP